MSLLVNHDHFVSLHDAKITLSLQSIKVQILEPMKTAKFRHTYILRTS